MTIIMLDLVIIGGAAAGCSAAIYAVRRKLNFKIIADNIGGEVALSGVVNNWPGIIEIQGFDLAQKFADHIKSYGVEIDEGWRVVKITPEKKHFIILAKNSVGKQLKLETKTAIVATGIHPRLLGVPGEMQFNRKGVTYCTVCDGPLFKNKITATVGSGNAALESAIMMSGIAKKVYLISKFTATPETNYGFPKGENILVEKVKSLPNVEIIYSAQTVAITGSQKVTDLKYQDAKGNEQTIAVDGIMVHIGMTPNSEIVAVKKDELGQIIVDSKCGTNVPGLFAAGDVTNIPYKQIGISAGQGIIAALAVIEYLNRWKE